MAALTFAVIADSHFRVDGDVRQDAHPSDPTHNARNRRVVDLVRRAAPAFVVHLGDVPHPVPRLADQHDAALQIATSTYAGLGDIPLHVVAGNHDVGDKPRPWANAAGASPALHAAFERTWGAAWGSFDAGAVHGVRVDTPILGTGSPEEAAQWAWLEADLAAARAAGKRIFVFVHYPPYLCTPDEDEHYDNLAEPGRTRLLDLLVDHGVEALFAGHVHRRFFDRHRGIPLYVAPSTAFVRPEYAELARVAPGREAGRDDPDLLGFFFVHVDDDGHRVEGVRALDDAHAAPDRVHPALRPGRAPAPPLGVGVFLRHDLAAVADVPYASLDEFARKTARADEPLYALWDVGVDRLRVPVADLRHPARRARLLHLVAHGARLLVFSAGRPNVADAALVDRHADALCGWEVVVPRASAAAAAADLAALGSRVPTFLSVAGRADADPSYFSHFPPHGLTPGEALADALIDAGGPTGVVFRAGPELHPLDAVRRLAVQIGDRPAILHVEAPRGQEGNPSHDDTEAAARMAEVVVAARDHAGVTVMYDTWMDHDRGYWPRPGLVDRRGVPRQAFHVARHLARLLPARVHAAATPGPIRTLDLGADGAVVLATGASALRADGFAAAVDLGTGWRTAPVDGEIRVTGPALLLRTA